MSDKEKVRKDGPLSQELVDSPIPREYFDQKYREGRMSKEDYETNIRMLERRKKQQQ